MSIKSLALPSILAALVGLAALPVRAGQCTVAVAANFTQPAKEIAAAFEAGSGHKLLLSFGASGQFYTQITQDAPFAVLLSADRERPEKAVAEGYGVPGSVFTYAVGKLALWSQTQGIEPGEAVLKAGQFSRLAIANPQVAPYGAAAVETLKALGVWEALKPKLVEGTSIAQTQQFVATGNAELGFVALSQIMASPGGSYWLVPEQLYQPIRQDAVLLAKGRDNPAAQAFLAFLKGEEALAVIRRYGYGVEGK
jgi:molybdate transport system substrate-binding protein